MKLEEVTLNNSYSQFVDDSFKFGISIPDYPSRAIETTFLGKFPINIEIRVPPGMHKIMLSPTTYVRTLLMDSLNNGSILIASYCGQAGA